jgi:hypothetical protein
MMASSGHVPVAVVRKQMLRQLRYGLSYWFLLILFSEKKIIAETFRCFVCRRDVM